MFGWSNSSHVEGYKDLHLIVAGLCKKFELICVMAFILAV